MSDKEQKLKKARAFLKGEADVLSEEPLDVTFWFYCDEERDAYSLASELQKLGHGIQQCEPDRDEEWLIISEANMPVGKTRLMHLMDQFEEMAETHQARFDGWETALDYDP